MHWRLPSKYLSSGVLVAAGLIASTAPAAAAPAQPINISGVWSIRTNTSDYPSFTLTIIQNGTQLKGPGPMLGSIQGQAVAWEVFGVASEDFYGGKGAVDAAGTHMAGAFADGFGATGSFVGVKVG
jgi:hypothetical protein